MELHSGQVHVLRLPGSRKPAEDQAQPLGVLGLDALGASAQEEGLETLAFEAPDHQGGRNPMRYGLQAVQRPCAAASVASPAPIGANCHGWLCDSCSLWQPLEFWHIT